MGVTSICCTGTGRLLFNISISAAAAQPTTQLAGLAPPVPSEQLTCITWARGAAAKKVPSWGLAHPL